VRLRLAVVLLSLLGGCATAPGQTGRPSTLSDLLLALDASEKTGGDPRCGSRSVSATEVLIPVELQPDRQKARYAHSGTCSTPAPGASARRTGTALGSNSVSLI